MVASLQKRELFARRAMRLVSSTLLDRGVPAARIRYEVFGPDLWAAQTAPGAES